VDELGRRNPFQIFEALVTEQREKGGIPVNDGLVAGDRDGIGRCFDELAEHHFRLAQRLLGLPAIANVPHEGHDGELPIELDSAVSDLDGNVAIRTLHDGLQERGKVLAVPAPRIEVLNVRLLFIGVVEEDGCSQKLFARLAEDADGGVVHVHAPHRALLDQEDRDAELRMVRRPENGAGERVERFFRHAFHGRNALVRGLPPHRAPHRAQTLSRIVRPPNCELVGSWTGSEAVRLRSDAHVCLTCDTVTG
jgi:hypothetical protein